VTCTGSGGSFSKPKLKGVKNAAELMAAVNSGNVNWALVFWADSVNVVFSIYPRRSTHGTEPTDKLHVVTTAAATSMPPPVKRVNDVLDELLGTPSVMAAEATVACGSGTSEN